MTPEQNLDEDILQCRAEIQRALGQDPAEEDDASAAGGDSVEPSDVILSEDKSDSAEIPEESDSAKEEELIEDWIEEEVNSNSGSFANLSLTEDDPAQESPVADKGTPKTPVPSDEKEEPEAEPKKLYFPKDLDYYNRVLKVLKDQKENLSQTCDEQEKHIQNLSEQTERLRNQYQQAEQKAADLAEQVRQLAEFQETSGRLKGELEQALSETEELRGKLAALQNWHQETIKEKNEQAARHKSRMEQMQSLESQQQALNQEFQSLKKKNEDLIKTIASLNQENEHLRQEKTSLHQQVHSLQEGLSRQQMESQKAIAMLREELAGKSEQLEDWRQQHDQVAEELKNARAQIESFEQAGREPAVSASGPDVYFPMEAADRPQEEPILPWLSEAAEPSMPQFDLSDQILAPQRRQNSGRRQPPSSGRTSPTDNVRKVVQQFVTTPAEIRENKPPVRTPSPVPPAAPAPEADFQRPPRRQAEEQPALIADIVQRDIETFCKQNQWVFIEFPSG